ncbi:hypothetical protein L2E82_39002 [Cichorium intybus]|uniref:Uncharacterized protein n=1 Tax=Cichorium intybus TaxID=13427 RepID=A0ACB9AHA2_CICIN|nr:hypothetical protein L2E82_39002 [Cichorium intybus]
MLTTHQSIFSTTLFSSLCVKVKVKKNINGETRISMAKKDDISQKSTPNPSLKIVSQAAVAVLGLGFIDAGYSGDWSRIGVISKETEDLLKVVAFIVIPLCFFLIFSISKTGKD